jgi:hypothetical protein
MLIKSADDHKKRLKLLEELKNSDRLDERQKKWLTEEYWRLAPGLTGERDAAHYLDMTFGASKNNALLHDLRLEADGLVAQIDHLVVTRLLHFYLLETKTYNGSLHINEHGEFTVEYTGERRYGIESPLEQSRRHETVLRMVLERLGITGRAGTEPAFVHVVMVHPKAIIHRPPADKFDTSMVIKADQFKTWYEKHIDKLGVTSTLAAMMNMRGRDTVSEWAEMLKAEHRPTNPLELPDFMKPKVSAQKATPSIAAPEPAALPKAVVRDTPAPVPPRPAAPEPAAATPLCADCGKVLTAAQAKFCQDNTQRFRGQFYCFEHQKQFKKKTSQS